MLMVADTHGPPGILANGKEAATQRESDVVAAIDLLPHTKYTELHRLSPC